MYIWLCPIKPRSWRIIKAKRLFGVPKGQIDTFRNVKPGDILVFHVFKTVKGIVALCRVVSEVFESYEDVWGKNRYPLRVHIEFIPNMTRDEDRPIPLSAIFGRDNQSEIEIQPYLKSVWITKISEGQYENLKRLFAEQT
jgi:hypothetical protein